MLNCGRLKFLMFSALIVFFVGVLMTPVVMGATEDQDSYLIGHGSLYMGDEWMKVTDKAIQLYGIQQGWNVITKNARTKISEQVKNLNYFLSQGVDGVVWSPVDAVGPVDAVEHLAKNGVPTVTYNTDVRTDAVPITVMFGNKEAGEIIAQEVVDHLKDKMATPEGLVIGLQGDPGPDTNRLRAEGCREVFSEYPDIQYIEFMNQESSMSNAQRNTFNAIQEHGKPVAIVAANTQLARGGVNALRQQDLLVPREDSNHVFISSIGGAPAYIDLMDQGYVDRGYVQPNLFYGPLAMHFLELVIEEGEEALPDVGETITAEELQITGGTYQGVSPWEEQVWAPAEVTTNYGHKWLKVQGMLVTPENSDDPRIWGNTAQEWLG